MVILFRNFSSFFSFALTSQQTLIVWVRNKTFKPNPYLGEISCETSYINFNYFGVMTLPQHYIHKFRFKLHIREVPFVNYAFWHINKQIKL